MKCKSKLSKVLKNCKGFSSMEIAIACMVFLVALSGFIDLTSVLRKLNTLSVQSNYISRTVGRQGGLRTATPVNYDAEDYVKSNDLYSNVQKSFESSGITDDKWTATVGGVTLSPGTNIHIYNYNEPIPVTVTVTYDWATVGNYLPMNTTQTKTTTRTILSSFRLREGDIKSQYLK